ncbi:adenylate/guanylate cyclase domain-containing protein, partial [Pseudomonas sp. BGM005]|nr:adenylate/guanylate cyclase domain-containing protein [Pseudomonas sp. BG5]
CIGIHFWLRYRPRYAGSAPLLLALAILVPVLSVLGFVQMGRTLADPSYQLATNPYEVNLNAHYLQDPEVRARIAAVRAGLYGAFSASLLIVV